MFMPCAGIANINEIPGGLTPYEQEAIDASIPELRESIQKGVEFVTQNSWCPNRSLWQGQDTWFA